MTSNHVASTHVVNKTLTTPKEAAKAGGHPQKPEMLLGNKMKRKRESLNGIEPVKLAPNPFNMTARNFPKRRHQLKNTTGYLNRAKGNSSSPSRALELVRSALQPSLNIEIEKVLNSYQEMFRMAAYNIGDNLKEPITEEHISHILRRSLEEAKSLFKLHVESKDGKESLKKDERLWTPARNVIIKKKKVKRDEREMKLKDSFDYPKWEESRLEEGTEAVMGVKANKILGYASARGRLYIRHPQLFKYMGDQDDKQWLYENAHMPITGGKVKTFGEKCQALRDVESGLSTKTLLSNLGYTETPFQLGLKTITALEQYCNKRRKLSESDYERVDQAFLMLADDIRLLATSHPDYKDNLGIKAEDVKGFVVPDFLLKKMRLAMKRQALIMQAKREPVDE